MIARLPAVAALVVVLGANVSADQFALVVTGASGGPPYAQKYATWRSALVSLLRERFGYAGDHLLELGEDRGASRPTRDNVRKAFADLRQRIGRDDQLLVLLVGHGTATGEEEAKFNLVGPDLSAREWAGLLESIPGRVVFVDASGASYPFLRILASKGRVVVTATDSVAQQFETVFPEFFIKAFADRSADLDGNGRVSVWEAFVAASSGVRAWYEQRGRLSTERALLDDTGAGHGREAQSPGADGAVARVTYLEPDTASASATAATAALIRRKGELEAQIETLKGQKPSMPPERYEAELEKLLLELARVSRAIRKD